MFRASFSVLNTWAMGDWQRAIEMYLKLPYEPTPQMIEGSKYHQEWQNEIVTKNKLPQVFGGSPLKNPKAELKLEKQLTDWLELVGIIDLYDGDTIYDWKTGKSKQNADGFQLKVYQILIPTARRGEIHHYDQYIKKVDVSVVHLTDKTLKEAVEWVVTFSSEMYHYLKQNGLINVDVET